MALYKPSEAARMLSDMTDRKVSPSTLRSWCSNDEVAPYLSDLATPDPGESRLLTDNDLAVLIRVQELRRQRLSFVEVGRKLSTSPGTPPGTPPESPDAPTDAPQTALAPAVDLDTFAAAIVAAIDANQAQNEANQIKAERIAVVEDRTKAQGGELRQVRYLMYGLLAAMVLVLVLLVMVLVLR
jgi:hypothetical protein